jgi:hypothetical protein
MSFKESKDGMIAEPTSPFDFVRKHKPNSFSPSSSRLKASLFVKHTHMAMDACMSRMHVRLVTVMQKTQRQNLSCSPPPPHTILSTLFQEKNKKRQEKTLTHHHFKSNM